MRNGCDVSETAFLPSSCSDLLLGTKSPCVENIPAVVAEVEVEVALGRDIQQNLTLQSRRAALPLLRPLASLVGRPFGNMAGLSQQLAEVVERAQLDAQNVPSNRRTLPSSHISPCGSTVCEVKES